GSPDRWGGPITVDHFVMWCSKVAVSALRPLPTLNATFPPAPHYAHGSYLGCLTANRTLGQGCRTRGIGRNSSASPRLPFGCAGIVADTRGQRHGNETRITPGCWSARRGRRNIRRRPARAISRPQGLARAVVVAAPP